MSRHLLLPLALVVVLVLIAAVAYLVMIDVKPRVRRPSGTPIADGLEQRLRRHVDALARDIGERNLSRRPEALRAAARYIRDVWRGQGLTVTEEAFTAGGQLVANLVAEQPGTDAAAGVLLVGAHYDTAPGTPGANDNGSGVAVLLELPAALAGAPRARTVRYVAFVNEEPPYFATEDMGSRVHARGARRRGENIAGMLSLETVGYYTDAPRSQAYPFPLDRLYPSTGNFLAVVGNVRSRGLVRDFLRHFLAATDFPAEAAATLESVPGIGWSDHWAFWQEGYPAIMLTVTAPFRYPYYHGSQDLPDRLAWPAFTRAAQAIMRAVEGLASLGP
jgi:Zn-dependent M28 family amino/carboxypeptidase